MTGSHGAMPHDGSSLSSENWAQVQDLLTEALERAPGERTAFLQDACGHDLTLHGEVESLLAAYDEAGSFLEALDPAGAAALLAEDAAEVGKIVGPYRIVSTLGRGGMGVVYLAEDNRLDRSVALKFLPPNLASDEEARRRLLTEARAAAALDHINIGVVHEISETDDGRSFIAMAYYEGETLREMISRGPLPVADAVRLARQIAEGLRAAHRHGVIHRDVKPSNIIVKSHGAEPSDKGLAKIIDFGIAWLVNAEWGEAGSALGTVAYMSPEQAQGRAVDHRTDIWSLGVLLYEMLTGLRPFRGTSQQGVIDSILNDDPEPISRLRSTVPAGLEAIVHRCLVKDSQARCPSMTDVIKQLESLRAAGEGSTSTETPSRPAARRMPAKYRLIILSVLGLAFVGVISIPLLLPSSPSTPEEPLRRVQLTSYPGHESLPAYSPDGLSLAFHWNGEDEDNWDIYVKQLGGGVYSPTRLTTHPGADYAPAWSPNGRYIAFVRQTEDETGIYRIAAEGGDAEGLTSLLIPSTLSWSPDGEALFFVDRDSADARSAVYTFSLETLERRKLTDPTAEAADIEDLYARISPDGTLLAFARGQRRVRGLENLRGDMTNQHTDLYVAPLSSLPGGRPRQITFDGSAINGLAWTPDSHEIVYASDRFDGYGNLRLWRVPLSGGSSVLIPTRGDRDVFPTITPDGQRLAYAEGTMVRNSFWRHGIAEAGTPEAAPERLIYSSAKEISAEYSPDGTRIVFNSRRSGHDEIWVCERDGRNPVQLTFFGGPRTGTPRWSPDGRSIVFDSWFEGPRARVYVLSAEGGTPRRVLPDSVHGGEPFWSRDGEWIYFRSQGGIWKAPVNGGHSVHVSSDGWSPRESPDGKWVYYWKEIEIPLGEIWRQPVAGGDESLVFDRFRANPWGTWVPFDDGMYFVDGNRQEGLTIKFYDFTRRDTTIILQAPDFTGHFGYIHVSPDREHLLARRQEGGGVDLVQLEHWW